MSKDHLWQKGKSGNESGRGKGVPNKINGLVKEMIANFINGTIMPDIEDVYHALEPKEKAVFIPKMLEFIIPKQRFVEIEAEVTEIPQDHTVIYKYPKNFHVPVNTN